MKRVKVPTTIDENLVTYQDDIFETLQKAKSYILNPELRESFDARELIDKISELESNLKRPEAWKTINESYVVSSKTTSDNTPERLNVAAKVLQGLVSNYTLNEAEDQDTLTELSLQLADNLIEKASK